MHNASLFRELRRQNGLTEQQVAAYLHMDRSTYAYYELGQTKPTIEFLIGLAHLYKISLNTLLCEPPIEERHGCTGMLFSQLSREEKELVILCRSLEPAQREALLAQFETLVQ